MQIEEKSVTIDGLVIRYLEAGNGSPVLMIHGGQAYLSADIFSGVMGPIADLGFRAIAYDQPGFGYSAPPPEYSVLFRTRFITRFMDALRLDAAALVGHAQAGGMVVRLALAEPARALAVVAVSNLTLLPPLAGSQVSRSGREPSRVGPNREDVLAELEDDLYRRDLITPELVDKMLALSSGKNAIAARERARVRSPWPDSVPIWDQLHKMGAPLLLLYGAADRESAGQRARMLKAQQPNLDVQIIPNAAHLLMWDAPDAFVTAVVDAMLADPHS